MLHYRAKDRGGPLAGFVLFVNQLMDKRRHLVGRYPLEALIPFVPAGAVEAGRTVYGGVGDLHPAAERPCPRRRRRAEDAHHRRPEVAGKVHEARVVGDNDFRPGDDPCSLHDRCFASEIFDPVGLGRFHGLGRLRVAAVAEHRDFLPRQQLEEGGEPVPAFGGTIPGAGAEHDAAGRGV